jgi:hypothetical protein
MNASSSTWDLGSVVHAVSRHRPSDAARARARIAQVLVLLTSLMALIDLFVLLTSAR